MKPDGFLGTPTNAGTRARERRGKGVAEPAGSKSSDYHKKGRSCAERPAYPCQMRVLPADGRDQKERQNARLADARHARREGSLLLAPATGTSHHLTMSKQQGLPRAREPRVRERLVGLGRLERPTSRLSGVRSNQLSYRPKHGNDRSRTPLHERSAPARPEGCWRRDVQTAAGINDPRRPMKVALVAPLAAGVPAAAGSP
jgi:hypothetical protein